MIQETIGYVEEALSFIERHKDLIGFIAGGAAAVMAAAWSAFVFVSNRRHQKELLRNSLEPAAALGERTTVATYGNQSPGIIHGDVQFHQKIVQEQKITRKKRWRPLAQCRWPGPEGEAAHTLWAKDVVLALHEVFRDGYEDFVAILVLTPTKTSHGDVCVYHLICAKPKFCHALERVRREALQQKSSTDSYDFLKDWDAQLDIPVRRSEMVPMQITYDSSRKRITVRGAEPQSTEPAAYPDHLGRTSEVLTFIATLVSLGNASTPSNRVSLGNVEWWNRDYRVEKLIGHILHDNTVQLSRLRVNVDDDEDWDYVNTEYDALLVESGQKRDKGSAGHPV